MILTRKTRQAAAKTIQSCRKTPKVGLECKSLAAASGCIDWSKTNKVIKPRQFVAFLRRSLLGWAGFAIKKNALVCAKSRKQRIGNFLAFQIYGSKGGYRQNLRNTGVTGFTGCPRFPFWNGR